MPIHRVPDVTVRREDYLPDPEVGTTHNDWYAQAWETEIGEVLIGKSTGNSPEEATITELTGKIDDDAVTTENEVVKTTTVENAVKDKTSTVNNTSCNLDVSDNP